MTLLPGAVVADANVILSAVIGGRAAAIFISKAGPRCYAAAPVGNEVRKYLPVLAAKRHLDVTALVLALEVLPVIWHGPDLYGSLEAEARRRLLGRDEDDWPTLALALTLSLPIWSQDKDFAVSGLTIYGTGQLLDALRAAEEPPER